MQPSLQGPTEAVSLPSHLYVLPVYDPSWGQCQSVQPEFASGGVTSPYSLGSRYQLGTGNPFVRSD